MSQADNQRPRSTPGEEVQFDVCVAGLLRSYPVAARALPPHHVRWGTAAAIAELERDDIQRAPEVVRRVADRFRDNDIVLLDGRATVPRDRGSDRANVYRTRAGVVDWVKRNIPEPTTFDCGHQGMRNLGDGQFTCQADHCDRTYDRETANAVFGNGDGAQGGTA